jgi:glucoamylase
LALSETDIDDAAYYSPKQDAIIHYKRNFYFIYSGSQQSSGHQCGVHDEESDAFKDVYDSELSGGSLVLYDGIRAVNSCLSWDIGTLQQNQQKKLSVLIAMESNEEKVLKVLAKNKQVENNAKFEETKKYWRSWISGFKHNFRDETQNRMVKRSLLTLKLLSDKNHGGIIAAPCMSPEYRFCWPRDATYVAYAFDMCGFHEESEQFYKWCKRAQEPEGGLYQRYFIEAKIRGPTWSSQIDEIATVIWGIGKHFDLTNDEKFLKSLWPMIKKAANFMTNLLDPKTILITSVGLWEEKFGTHVYSNATVYNALKTASVIAKDLEKSSLSKKWRRAAEKIQNSLIALAWDSSKGHFIKTVNPRDESLDISVIGLSFPFEVLQAQDSMMEKTAVAIEKIFDYKVGGIGRYPQDTYYGGNPWILSTLWLGLYYKNVEDVDKLEKIVNWTINHATELDLLSEQVNKIDGSSISAVPLAWSHAFFILAVLGLAELKSVKE